MNVGIGLPNTLAGANRSLVVDWARRADEGPFSSLGVFDRLMYESLEPLATLAAAAAVTERIRLATTIVSGPLRNDALLAKQAATVDVLSGGRLTLGLALGARKEDYDAAGIDFRSRGRRLTEQLASLRDAWEDPRSGPAPVQDGGPELLVGGMSDPAYARAARLADGFIHGGGPPGAFARAAQAVRGAWADAGRPGTPRLWAMGYFALGGPSEAAAGREYLLDYYAFTGPFAGRIAEGLLTSPQAVAQLARGYADAGCHELVLFPTVGQPDQLDRLADVVGGLAGGGGPETA